MLATTPFTSPSAHVSVDEKTHLLRQWFSRWDEHHPVLLWYKLLQPTLDPRNESCEWVLRICSKQSSLVIHPCIQNWETHFRKKWEIIDKGIRRQNGLRKRGFGVLLWIKVSSTSSISLCLCVCICICSMHVQTCMQESQRLMLSVFLNCSPRYFWRQVHSFNWEFTGSARVTVQAQPERKREVTL